MFQTPPRARLECGSSGLFFKRLIGLPSDVWEERNGYIHINGKQLEEPYVKSARRDHRTLTLKDLPPRGKYQRIPQGYYLVLGDNRRASCDSRQWGLVPRQNVAGKVVEIFRPSSR